MLNCLSGSLYNTIIVLQVVRPPHHEEDLSVHGQFMYQTVLSDTFQYRIALNCSAIFA